METIYGKDFKIDYLGRDPENTHLIIKAKVAKSSEDGWEITWNKQTVAIPLDTVYEILDILGVEYKKKF